MTTTAIGTTERRAADALLVWDERAKRRRLAGMLERGADAAVAAGGIVAANAALPLELGLPSGRPGLSLGFGLIGAGFAWIVRSRPRRRATDTPQPNVAVAQEVWRAA